MKASDQLHVEWVDGEAVVLDQETGELHYLNGPAALVYALIEEHGFEKGLEEARSRFGHEHSFETDLAVLLKDLSEKGILVD